MVEKMIRFLMEDKEYNTPKQEYDYIILNIDRLIKDTEKSFESGRGWSNYSISERIDKRNTLKMYKYKLKLFIKENPEFGI